MNNINMKRYNVSRETLYPLFKICILFFVIVIGTVPSYYAIEQIPGLTTDRYLLIDKNSEMIIAGENYNKVSGIASITKIMSYYVFMDKIVEDEINIDETIITVSDEIVDNFASDPNLSGVYFDYGDEYTLNEMLNLMLVYSDNGATKAISEHLYGSEEAAVEAMNAKAKQLGLENTIYYNTTGLTMSDYKDAKLEGTSPADFNRSTAREQLILAESLLDTYPQILDIVGKSTIEFQGQTLTSFNLMLPDLDYDYPGVVGLKTGSSNEAGYCFLGYYINPVTKKEYLSIVLNSESTTKRFNDTTYIYNWLDDTEMETLMLKDKEFKLQIIGAEKSFYTVKTNANYEIPKNSTFNLERKTFEYNKKYFNENNKLVKTIPEGEEVGYFVYTIAEDDVNDNEFESLTAEKNTIKLKVFSTEEIKVEGPIGAVITGVTSFFINVLESM